MRRDPAACLADMLDYARDAQSFVVGMRNIIAHDYLGIRMSRVFETVATFVPLLISRLPDMIDELVTMRDKRADPSPECQE